MAATVMKMAVIAVAAPGKSASDRSRNSWAPSAIVGKARMSASHPLPLWSTWAMEGGIVAWMRQLRKGVSPSM